MDTPQTNRIATEQDTKTCRTCNITKAVTNYHIRSNGKTRNECKECRRKAAKIQSKKYYTENREAVIEAKKLWRKNNSERDKESARIYAKRTHKAIAARSAAYRARKLQATAQWANHDIITKIYENCPTGYHVDHIIPLKGKNVCGLHVESNLQWLPANENKRKSNCTKHIQNAPYPRYNF